MFKLENDWLKYESSDDEESCRRESYQHQFDTVPGGKFSFFIEDSSLSLSPTDTDRAEEAANDDAEFVRDEEEQQVGHAEEEQQGTASDPLFHALFHKRERRGSDDRSASSPLNPLVSSDSKQCDTTSAHSAGLLPLPTTSSSSLSPLRESPEREIYTEFSQIYDLNPTTPSPSNRECADGEQSFQEEEDLSQHLSFTPERSPKATKV